MDYINELLAQKRYSDVFSCIYSLIEEKKATKELYPVLFQLAKLGYHFQVYDILVNLRFPGKEEKRIIENEIKNEQRIYFFNEYQKEVYEDAIWRISSEITNTSYFLWATFINKITNKTSNNSKIR